MECEGGEGLIFPQEVFESSLLIWLEVRSILRSRCLAAFHQEQIISHDSFDLDAFRRNSNPMRTGRRGVYFRFKDDKLQYIGRSWNCKLRAREHAYQERFPCSEWRMIPVDDEADCARLEREMIAKFSPLFNRGSSRG